MEILAAVILGIIQGLTEFLPVSSSAHLILVPWIAGWKPEGLMFDVSLHVGTALAILAFFWSDWIELAGEVLRGIAEGNPLGNPKRRLAWFLVIGTLPAMAVGLTLEKTVEDSLRSPLVTVFTLVAFGILLYAAERMSRMERSLDLFSWGDSIWIGLSQAVALIPGVSRSGITISTALLRNAERSAAARFSFLLSTPIIVGAGVLECWHFIKALRHPSLITAGAGVVEIKWGVLAAGIISAAVVGFLCIRYFLRYIQNNSFVPFVIYRFLLALVVLTLYLRHGG
ncbi:MAG TPA: undecaprenyl-diphosphate phosphatase [Acidobacteriota bacterium]|nr:undecaprenyl-diphosphate phosphatase [Acidobacteriota bacterium]